ncbi:MAG: hypothetical protein VXW43_19865, partial [Pseudomonadota bacterium]|nr:hypothetical protein [Pseudomonadota bacterium]
MRRGYGQSLEAHETIAVGGQAAAAATEAEAREAAGFLRAAGIGSGRAHEADEVRSLELFARARGARRTDQRDEALREIARRLLGLRSEQARLVPTDVDQLGAWAQTAKVSVSRVLHICIT